MPENGFESLTPPVPEDAAARAESEAREREAKAMADKYIARIPPEQRVISSPRSVEALLGIVVESGIASTYDKLSHVPNDGSAFINDLAKRDSLIQALRGFVDNIKLAFTKNDDDGAWVALTDEEVKPYAKTNKIREIPTGELPPLVRDALLKILLDEGPLAATEVFAELIESLDEQRSADAVDLIRACKEKHQAERKKQDKVRARAMMLFFEGIFSDFMEAEETKFYMRAREFAKNEKLRKAVASAIGKQENELIPQDLLTAFENRGVEALTDEERAAIEAALTPGEDVNDALSELKRHVIEPRLAKRFVEKKAEPEA